MRVRLSAPRPLALVRSLALASIFFWAMSQGAASAVPVVVPEGEDALVLEGVIVAASPSDSVALVRRAGGARARILRIGQEIQGYLLVQVTKSSARLHGRDRDLQLFLSGERSESAAPVGTASPTLPAELPRNEGHDAHEEWIRRSIPRAAARERLSREISVILSETDVAPRVEDGEVTGLRVARVPDGTLLSESGLLPGDVVISIDGEPIRRVDSLWPLLSRLLDKDEVRVVVRRNGEVLKLAYDFTK